MKSLRHIALQGDAIKIYSLLQITYYRAIALGFIRFSPDGHWLFLIRTIGAVTALDATPITTGQPPGVSL